MGVVRGTQVHMDGRGLGHTGPLLQNLGFIFLQENIKLFSSRELQEFII